MQGLIRIKNDSYGRYEELLLERDAIRKDAYLYDRAYIRTFGEQILEVFRKKLECVKKKKMIEFCQVSLNHGQTVDADKLQEYIKSETRKLQDNLDDMIKDYDNAKSSVKITQGEASRIKQIYRKLVKIIHPDVNPMIETRSDLNELWQRISLAYTCNNLNDLQELEVLAIKAVNDSTGEIEIVIPDLEDKIKELEKEIANIKETDPYQYKFLLEDEDSVKTKKNELSEEIDTWKEYSIQLDEVISGIIRDRVKFTWRIN